MKRFLDVASLLLVVSFVTAPSVLVTVIMGT